MLELRFISNFFYLFFLVSAVLYCGFTRHCNWFRNEAVEVDRCVRGVRWRERGGETPRSVKAVQDCLLSCVGVNGIFLFFQGLMVK